MDVPQAVRVGLTDHTGSIVSLIACIFDLKKKFLCNWKLSYCYNLGMVKTEAFDDSHFMHQTVRVCQTDHTDSIISCIACSFDLKNNLYCY